MIYLHGYNFLKEDDPVRIAEANLLFKCYGIYPGKAPHRNENGEVDYYYMLSGRKAHWDPNSLIIRGMTALECGAYGEN